MKNKILAGIAISLFMIGMAGLANATLITGSVWSGPTASPSANDPEIVPTWAAQANFTVDAINFDSRRDTFTYNSFLQGATSSNLNNLVWTYTATGFDINSFYTGSGFEGSFFQFTGTAYFEESTQIVHDDGFYLTLGNVIYDYSTPVSPTTTTLDNVAGNYSFILNFGATNGFPEVLIAPITNPVPEPATMLLFGAGLVGLAGSRLRKNKK